MYFQFKLVQKNPCELRVANVIFSLDASRSVGMEYGSMNVSAYVDTLGRLSVLLKDILGTAS